MEGEHFWGTMLDEERKEFDWGIYSYVNNDLECPGIMFDQTLFLQLIVLGDDAKPEELNVVEVETKGYDSEYKFPIAILKGGGNESKAMVKLSFPKLPLLFRLVEGSGPVYLIGKHVIGSIKPLIEISSEEEMEVEEEEEEEGAEEKEEEELEEKEDVEEEEE